MSQSPVIHSLDLMIRWTPMTRNKYVVKTVDSAANHARRASSVACWELTLAVAFARRDLIELRDQRGKAALTRIEEAPLVLGGLGSMRAFSHPGHNDRGGNVAGRRDVCRGGLVTNRKRDEFRIRRRFRRHVIATQRPPVIDRGV